MKSQKEARRIRERYGPWAVVTGASSGIGKGLAVELARCGLSVAIVARRADALEELAQELHLLGAPQVRSIPADLSTDEGIAKVESETTSLDAGLLIASAGFGTSGDFLNSPVAAELDMLAVNCRALLALSHSFGQRFVQRGSGGLVLLGSIVGFQGVPRAAHYAATKAYVQSLAEGLHHELAARNVDVLSSAPGPTASGFAERANMRMGSAMRAADLAEPTLRALGRKPTVLPGTLTKLLVFSLSTLPRALRVRVMAMVMGGMTAHQDEVHS